MERDTVKRHRNRSWVRRPDTSTNPASSRDKKLRFSVFFSPSPFPLHPLFINFLVLHNLFFWPKLVRVIVTVWSFEGLKMNGDWWWLLKGLREVILLLLLYLYFWNQFLDLKFKWKLDRRWAEKRKALSVLFNCLIYVVETRDRVRAFGR